MSSPFSRYDELEEQARELAKQREAEKALAESNLKDIGQELALKPAYEAELEEAQHELANIEKMTGEQEARLNELRQKRAQLTNKQQQLVQLEEHIGETTRARQHWDEQAKQHHWRIKEYEELNTQRATIEENYTQLILAQKISEELNQTLRLFTTLNEHKYQLEMAVVQASQSWLKEHALTENKISESEATWQKLPRLKSELQQVQAELSRLTQEEETLSQQRQARQELTTSISHLAAGKTRREEEIKEIDEKLNLLLSEEGVKCPLCETELGAGELKLIETKYTTERQGKSDSLASIQQQLGAKKIELISLETEISRGETRLNQARTAAQSKAILLNHGIAEAEKASRQLEESRIRLAEIEERLAKKDFATGEQEALHRLKEEMAKLDYDSRQHEELRLRLSQLQLYELPKRRLEEADRLIEREREALSRAEQAAGELHHRLETDELKKRGITTELSLLPRVAQELAQVEDEYRRLTSQQKQAQERVGNARGKLERCAQLEI
ncbi:MAG: family ATPase, partial [Dehalococcoidales bacterium]|nr:family ATPase [Dehalococcoidales bacterium]